MLWTSYIMHALYAPHLTSIVTILLYTLPLQSCQSQFGCSMQDASCKVGTKTNVHQQGYPKMQLIVATIDVPHTTSSLQHATDCHSSDGTQVPSTSHARSSSQKNGNCNQQDAQQPSRWLAVSNAPIFSLRLPFANAIDDTITLFHRVFIDKNYTSRASIHGRNMAPIPSPYNSLQRLSEQRALGAQFSSEGGKLDIPSVMFGKQAWTHYFGDIGESPALPPDIQAILTSRCPFWPDRLVYETHLLVLIPATVNGQSFSLNLLRELIQCPQQGGYKAACCYYDNGMPLKNQIGAISPSSSYWVCMTRDVLPNCQSSGYGDHQACIAKHVYSTALSDALPTALEAATAICLHYVRSGEQLFSQTPCSYTYCKDLICYAYKYYPVIVGGYKSPVHNINTCSLYDSREVGVVCCQRF